jgi:hypothetical protein
VKLMSLEGLDDNWKLKGAYFYELHSIGKERGTALGGSRYPCSFIPPRRPREFVANIDVKVRGLYSSATAAPKRHESVRCAAGR